MAEMNKHAELMGIRSFSTKMTEGKDAREEVWTAPWLSALWGTLLQPAPLSFSLLGSLLNLAHVTDGFSLVDGLPDGGQELKYVEHPESFLACQQQLVGAVYTAFDILSSNMETIKTESNKIPSIVDSLFRLVMKGTPYELGKDLTSTVDMLSALLEQCTVAARRNGSAFQELASLCQELRLLGMRKLALTTGSNDSSYITGVLKTAVATHKTLFTQFSQIAGLLSSISNVIDAILTPSAQRLIRTLSDLKERNTAGATLSAFSRQTIYRQCWAVLKIAGPVEQTCSTYGEVYAKQILPVQRTAGEMMKLSDSGSDSKVDKRELLVRLVLVQAELALQSADSSTNISKLASGDQTKFNSAVEERLKEWQARLQAVFSTAINDAASRNPELIEIPPGERVAVVSKAPYQHNPMFVLMDA